MFLFKKRAQCGHRTAMRGRLIISGEKFTFDLRTEGDEPPLYCANCLADKAINCAWCKGIILPGNPVTLYYTEKGFMPPTHAVIYGESKNGQVRVVGCLGWDCADTGADRAGFWSVDEQGRGYVERVPTGFEMVMSSSPGSIVLVQDTSNQKEVPTVILP